MDRTDTVELLGSPAVDDETAAWLGALRSTGPARDSAVAELHALLLRASRSELCRRAPRTRIRGPEADDLAEQAADDATVSVLAKLATFRGDSRFTTWVYKFAIFEVSAKLGRHFWRQPSVILETEDWNALADRLGPAPGDAVVARDLLDAVRRAVEEQLTDRQRHTFVAIVVQGIPLDAVVAKLGTNRNAVYKTLFDARRKIRDHLVTNGYVDPQLGRRRA